MKILLEFRREIDRKGKSVSKLLKSLHLLKMNLNLNMSILSAKRISFQSQNKRGIEGPYNVLRLFFDEATSSLDNKTEKDVSIPRIGGKR